MESQELHAYKWKCQRERERVSVQTPKNPKKKKNNPTKRVIKTKNYHC